jgi:hypothetical protein
MVDKNDALAREVDEELRREQLQKLWERYGTYVLAAAVAIVVGVGGFKWYEQRQIAAAQAAGSRFEAATNLVADGKADEATKAFDEIARDGPAGYAVLAQLREAGVLAASGKSADALAVYEQLAQSSSADPLLRDFARLQAASLRVGQADWTEMQNRLNPLIGDRAPWRYLARELLGIAALKAGKTAEARTTLEAMVADPMVPASLGERARQLMSQVVTAEQAAAQPPPAPPAETAAPAAAAAAPAEPPAEASKPAAQKAPAKGKK